ncbi:MAG: TIGR00725 family protein [Leptolyngbyaceae cyanobacterium MO_188.B28]|nr:TIGR00725 family protein [Leptolyngbyaceae cyanobacterium MO_188.B28]
MHKVLIGVMGPGNSANPKVQQVAYELGRRIAQQGWGVLTGGRNVGVMEAASQGAKLVGGLTIGILPTSDAEGLSKAVDIPILTDMGQARNNINVLSSQVIIACGIGAGTASEIALAIKSQTPVILMEVDASTRNFFQTLSEGQVLWAPDPAIAIEITQEILAKGKSSISV